MKVLLGGAAGTLFTPLPWKMTDDMSIWTQNWPWIPKNPSGPSEYVSVTSKICPSSCGLMVRTVGGLPIRAVGDPEHPLSQGKISSLAAAEVQMLYSPARTTLTDPLFKSADGAFSAATMENALAFLEEVVADAKGGDKLAFVSGDENGTVNEVFSAFVAEAGSDKYFVMPGEAQQASAAWRGVMGGEGQLGFDFENAEYVLALGADVLESWGTVVANRRAYAEGREYGDEIDHGYAYTEPENKYVYVGPVQNNTAAGADQWVPALPGSQVAVALGLVKELVAMGASGPGLDGIIALAEGFSPAKVEELSGVTAEDLKAMAEDLADTGKKRLVVVGSEFGQGAGVAAHMMGVALNVLIGSFGAEGGMTVVGDIEPAVDKAMEPKDMLAGDLVAYLEEIKAGSTSAPKVLITYEANPFYSLPDPEALAEALKDTVVVCFTSFFDETAHMADLVIPVPM
ncbi:MAG: molybdopterin oxidoreductase, partial [Desulfovibrio sp.]